VVSTAEAVTIVNDKHKLPPIVAVLDPVKKPRFSGSSYRSYERRHGGDQSPVGAGTPADRTHSGPARSPAAIHRRDGYLAALAAAGIPSGEESCVPGEFTIASGEAAMASLLARPKRPTAIFCANDEIAIGAIRAIKAAGLKVPQDISVMGMDDQRIAGSMTRR